MEEDPESTRDDIASPPIADGGASRQYQIMQPGQIAATPLAGSTKIEGTALRYRLNRTQAWSYLHYRYSALAQPTGHFIRTTPAARAASEKRIRTPWGVLMVLLWDLGPDLDLVAGREALGGPSPCPWRPFFFAGHSQIRAHPADSAATVPGPLVDERPGEKIGGRVILFPGHPTR